MAQVYFDMSWTGPVMKDGKVTSEIKEQSGRLVFNLFDDVVPKTAANFRALCTGEKGFGYSGSKIFKILPQFGIWGGDVTCDDGTSNKSIYGKTFDDESFELKHDTPGLLTMANSGPNTNGSQFIITTAVTTWLNGRHVVFGQVANNESLEIIYAIECAGRDDGKIIYSSPPTIVAAGTI